MCPFFNRRWKKCVTLSNQKTETTSWSKTWVISLALGLQLLVLLLLLLLLRIRVRGIVTIASECWVLPYSQLLSHSDSSSWAPLMDKSREAERLNGLPKVTSSVLECPDKFSAFILFFHSCCLPVYQVSQTLHPQSLTLLSSCLTCTGLWPSEAWLSLYHPQTHLLSPDCLSQCQSKSL